VRLRKLGEKKREIVEQRKKEERDNQRDKAKKEREAKERCIREWEQVEA
jgi:hypothetical protein